MKRFILIALCAWSIGLAAQTTGSGDPALDPKDVPAVVNQNFTSRFPNITPTWHRDGKNFRVNYIDPQSKLGHIIVYDQDGNVVRSENEVDAAGYPTAIGDYYSDNYPGETFQVWSTDDKTGARTLYYSNRNDETVWFDQEGKVMPGAKAKTKVKKTVKKK